ncbi:MAG: DUF4236 domain-containing protein [Clostridia bacterium]|nr:DUF4236 domain-containing protein [Clostridia bacterium]
MGLNFRKSISLGHGMKINLSKSGPSFSFGRKGLRQTISATGRATTSVGIPGTGVYYTKQTNVKKIGGALKNKFGKKNKEEAAAEGGKSPIIKTAKDSKAPSSEAEKTVAEYEAYVNAIQTIHRTCDDTIEWEKINTDSVPAGYKKGTEDYENWEKLHELAGKVLDGDIDAYLEVVDQMKPFDDLLDYGSGFEVGTEDDDQMTVEFTVKSDEVVPTNVYSILASGKLSEKAMSKTAYNELVQDYVCSTVIRVARDLFALLPIERVIIHAVDSALNPATGNEEEVTILSVAIDKSRLSEINMEKIDPSDALGALECNMSFSKTNGFREVSRL